MIIKVKRIQVFTFWCDSTDENRGDFICFPHVPTQSLGSLITLKPEFMTVFLTTSGVILLNFHFKQRLITQGSSITKEKKLGSQIFNILPFKLGTFFIMQTKIKVWWEARKCGKA